MNICVSVCVRMYLNIDTFASVYVTEREREGGRERQEEEERTNCILEHEQVTDANRECEIVTTTSNELQTS